MKLAWVLVILYTGPIGLLIYLLSCRQPMPGTHDAFIADHWKQAVGSLLHCVAGDATGVIISAAIVHQFGLPNGLDLVIEYLSAFVAGLLVFQALFMLAMYGGHYWLAVRKTFFAETVSMNMVMVGMLPVMVVLMHTLPGANDPRHALFWGVMSLATLAGMATAYPINSWLVAKGLKHGMLSAIPAPRGTEKAAMAAAPSPTMQQGHHGASLSRFQSLVVLLGTIAALAITVLVTAQFVPIRFCPGP